MRKDDVRTRSQRIFESLIAFAYFLISINTSGLAVYFIVSLENFGTLNEILFALWISFALFTITASGCLFFKKRSDIRKLWVQLEELIDLSANLFLINFVKIRRLVYCQMFMYFCSVCYAIFAIYVVIEARGYFSVGTFFTCGIIFWFLIHVQHIMQFGVGVVVMKCFIKNLNMRLRHSSDFKMNEKF